jgi:hypothetical protein
MRLVLFRRAGHGDALDADLSSALELLAQYALAESLLVVGLALVGVFLALGQHRVDELRYRKRPIRQRPRCPLHC